MHEEMLYLHCAAYVLMHDFQGDVLAGTELERCTNATMRDKLIRKCRWMFAIGGLAFCATSFGCF